MTWIGCLAALSIALLAVNRLVARRAEALGVVAGSARVAESTGARYEVLRHNRVVLGTFEGVLDGRSGLLAAAAPRDSGGTASDGAGAGEPPRPTVVTADRRLAEAQAEWDRGVAELHRLSGGPRSA